MWTKHDKTTLILEEVGTIHVWAFDSSRVYMTSSSNANHASSPKALEAAVEVVADVRVLRELCRHSDPK